MDNLDLDFDLDLTLDLDDDGVSDGLDRAAQITHPNAAADEVEWPDEHPDYATDQANQLGAVLTEMRALAQHAKGRMEADTDTHYFATIVFLDHPQLAAFLKATGWNRFGAPHIDGLALAKHLNIELPESSFAPYDLHPDKRLVDEDLVLDLD